MKDLKLIFLVAAALLAAACTKESYDLGPMNDAVYGSSGTNKNIKGNSLFYEFCLKNFDFNGDGSLSKAELGIVKVLDCSSQGLTNLDGLEHFTSLDTLKCSHNKIKELVLSQNKNLRFLDCSYNLIEKLDISATAISTLYCAPMDDEKGNNVLEYLFIYRGQNIEGVTYGRDSFKARRIPEQTKIISVPSSKDGDTDTE